jgi:cytochrome c-type biogenesis protein CcmF
VAHLVSEKRNFVGGGQTTTEAGIDAGLWRDLYVALGEPLNDAGQHWAVRLYYRPAVRWLWLGALIMALGGAWAIADRRYRRNPEEDLT